LSNILVEKSTKMNRFFLVAVVLAQCVVMIRSNTDICLAEAKKQGYAVKKNDQGNLVCASGSGGVNCNVVGTTVSSFSSTCPKTEVPKPEATKAPVVTKAPPPVVVDKSTAAPAEATTAAENGVNKISLGLGGVLAVVVALVCL